MKTMPLDNFNHPVIEWNNNFPLDRWWRKKYNVPYGAANHLEISQAQILFEFVEERLFKQIAKNEDEMISKYQKFKDGEWLSPAEITDEDFDNIVID